MSRYQNEQALQAIGNRIKNIRIEKSLEIEDISEMTGFSQNTIKKIEAGSETSLSYFIEICLALDVHPKIVFNIPLRNKPLNPLSAGRMEKTRLTPRIKKYIIKGYFTTDRSTSEVVAKLSHDYKTNTTSSSVSVILNRLVKEGLLKSKKRSNKKIYFNHL